MRNRKILRHTRGRFNTPESARASTLPVFDYSSRATRAIDYADKIPELEDEMDFTCPYYDINANGLSNLIIEDDNIDPAHYNLTMQICKVDGSPEFALYFKPNLFFPSVEDVKTLAEKWVDDENSLYISNVVVRLNGIVLVSKDSIQADQKEFEIFLAYCKNFIANFWYFAYPQLPIKMPRVLVVRGEIQQFLDASGIDLNGSHEISDNARRVLFGLDS